MSAGTWPATLPQIPDIGVSEEIQSNVVASEVDSGPPKLRRRSTKRRVFQTVPITLTGAQYATLRAFYEDTLLDGTLTFDWADALTDVATEFRFVSPPKPDMWTAAPNPDDRMYTINLELEVM
jgi:hypothetical protein